MNRILTHQTKIAVQIVVNDDTGSVADFLMVLTLLIEMLVSFGQWIVSITLLISDITEAVSFTFSMGGIAFRSLAYGFRGMSL